MAVKAARTGRGNVVQLARPTLRETLGQLAPGTALRDGLERILRGRTGALIVLGYDDAVDAIYKLNRTPATPPAELFHGTAPETVAKIRRGGLLPMRRQYVHLSVDRDTAHAVGRRKSRHPVILRIDAAAAASAGVPFYAGNDKVWLADRIGAEFISDEPS